MTAELLLRGADWTARKAQKARMMEAVEERMMKVYSSQSIWKLDICRYLNGKSMKVVVLDM